MIDDGNRYEGHWSEDKKEGPGRYYYFTTNKLYEGEWLNDVAKCGVRCCMMVTGIIFIDVFGH